MTYLVRNGYQHPNDEVVLTSYEVLPKYSDRGLIQERLYRMHVFGELLYEPPSLLTKMQQLIDVYSVDGGDVVLYMDDGTPTSHALYSSSSMAVTPVRVAYRSWPKGDAAELCVTRTFSIRLEQVLRDLDSEIIAFSESIRHIGNGGPAFVTNTLATGPVDYQWVAQHTPQILIQSGSVTGYDGWPLIRVPPPLYPQYEHQEQRIFELVGPQFRGNAYTHYEIRWAYKMSLPTGTNNFPAQF